MKNLVSCIIVLLVACVALSSCSSSRHATKAPFKVLNTRKTPNITSGRNRVQGIVLHHTGNASIENSLNTLCDPKKHTSCHVLIDRDGTRYILAPATAITHHAGRSMWHDQNACNTFMLGVMFQGNTTLWPLTAEQIDSAVEYMLYMILKYNVPLENIVTHEMVRNEWMKENPKIRIDKEDDITQKEYNRVMKKLLEALKRKAK